ncbi:hypothetical protein, partial [Azospirillum sp. B4]|uniref:hypothetical protein n=1 Tax=Azospirillum sp. B4 TaxID=95605 RepID=UPI0005C96E3C
LREVSVGDGTLLEAYGAKAERAAAASSWIADRLRTVTLESGAQTRQLAIPRSERERLATELARAGLTLVIADGVDRKAWTPVPVPAGQTGSGQPLFSAPGAGRQSGPPTLAAELPEPADAGQPDLSAIPSGSLASPFQAEAAPSRISLDGVEPPTSSTSTTGKAEGELRLPPLRDFVRQELHKRAPTLWAAIQQAQGSGDADRIRQAYKAAESVTDKIGLDHKAAVMLALQDGRPVPPAVLRDYTPADLGYAEVTEELLATFGYGSSFHYVGGRTRLTSVDAGRQPMIVTEDADHAARHGTITPLRLRTAVKGVDLTQQPWPDAVRQSLARIVASQGAALGMHQVGDLQAMLAEGRIGEKRELERRVLAELRQAGYTQVRYRD